MRTESQVGGLYPAVSKALINEARRGAQAADVALELRREFVTRGLFTQAMEDDFGVVSEVPLGIVSSAVLRSRADEAAAKANLEAVQASLLTPVVTQPAPAVEEELPPTPEEHEAAQKAARKARLETATTQALAEIEARRAAKACTVVSRPAAPVAAPAPAPKAPRVPGHGECWCLNERCKSRHVIAIADAFVPQDSVLIEAFGKNVAPTVEQLLTLAVCRGVFQDNTGLRWYRLLETHERIARVVAGSVEREATEAERTIGGKLGRMVGQAVRREAQKPVASSVPAPAKPAPSAPPAVANKRGERKAASFQEALDMLKGKK